MLNKIELDLLKHCIMNNPRDMRYISEKDSNLVNVNDPKKMQQEFISKLDNAETLPNSLTTDDYTNLRMYVTDEFLSPKGWNSQTSCPTEYGLRIDELLNKLSSLADSSEKNS